MALIDDERAPPSPLARRLALAAVGGLVSGASACAAQDGPATVYIAAAPEPTESAPAEPPEPRRRARRDANCCKGMNACKGKGSCKTDRHACKGMNECKGLGGCRSVDCRR